MSIFITYTFHERYIFIRWTNSYKKLRIAESKKSVAQLLPVKDQSNIEYLIQQLLFDSFAVCLYVRPSVSMSTFGSKCNLPCYCQKIQMENFCFLFISFFPSYFVAYIRYYHPCLVITVSTKYILPNLHVF